MSENNITPTSSSSTAQLEDQLQSKTSKPLDGASCSASLFDVAVKDLCEHLQGLRDAYHSGPEAREVHYAEYLRLNQKCKDAASL